MSIADEAPPPAPDDDDYSPEPTRHDRVQAELARKTELIAIDYRAIAQAQARVAEQLVELQEWSEKPEVAEELHGNPVPAPDRDRAPLTPDQARAALFARWQDKEVARRTIVSETACLLRVHERGVEQLMDEAQFLCYTAPATMAALASGEISYRHAITMVEQMRTIPLEGQASFEGKVLPVAKVQSVGRFRDKARRLRERLHPESIVVRTRNAMADRRTYWEPDRDGMGWLHWYSTAQHTQAACDRITSMAAHLKKLGDPTQAGAGGGAGRGARTGTDSHTGPGPGSGAGTGTGTGTAFGSGQETAEELSARTLDNLRADVTAALLLDGITPDGLGAGIHGTVMVTVSAETLLGRSDEPAILEGYGPLSPEAAREIAGDVPGFIRLLTHPETGVVLSLGKGRHKNTAGMKKWLRMRDETCRFPGCNRPAVTSDIDHTEACETGGRTDQDNLAHLCEPHHRLKHLTQWTVKQEPGGVLFWTSPGKRSYRTDPANLMGPPRPQPPAAGPASRKRPADESDSMRTHQPTRHPSPPVPDNPPF